MIVLSAKNANCAQATWDLTSYYKGKWDPLGRGLYSLTEWWAFKMAGPILSLGTKGCLGPAGNFHLLRIVSLLELCFFSRELKQMEGNDSKDAPLLSIPREVETGVKHKGEAGSCVFDMNGPLIE